METSLHKSQIAYEEQMAEGLIVNPAQQSAERIRKSLFPFDKEMYDYATSNSARKKTVLFGISNHLINNPSSIPAFIIGLQTLPNQSPHIFTSDDQSKIVTRLIPPLDHHKEIDDSILQKAAQKEGKKLLHEPQTMHILIQMLGEPLKIIQEQQMGDFPSDETAPDEIANRVSDCATIILRGIAQSLTSEEEVVEFFEHFTRTAQEKQNIIYERIFFSVYAGVSPIIRPEDRISSLLGSSLHSEDNSTLARQWALHECAVHIGEVMYPQGDLIETNAAKTLLVFGDSLRELDFKRLREDYSRHEVLSVFYRSHVENTTIPVTTESLISPLPFPESAFYEPNETWRYYQYLLHKYHTTAFQRRTIMLVAPQDNTVRLAILPHGKKYENDTIISLREAYQHGQGTITEPLTIENALSLIPPIIPIKDRHEGLFNEVVYNFPELGALSIQNQVFVDITLGNYTLKVIADSTGRLFSLSGQRLVLPGQQQKAWEEATKHAFEIANATHIEAKRLNVTGLQRRLENHKQNLISRLHSESEDLSNHEAIEGALHVLTPEIPPSSENHSIILQSRKDKLDALTTAKIIHGYGAHGEIVEVVKKDRKITQGIHTFFFNWGEEATTNVDLLLGKLRIPLRLDMNYRLIHRDGSPLTVDETTRLWWETLILSHLEQLICSPERTTVHTHTGEGKKTGSIKPAIPHRRSLTEGAYPTLKQSVIIAGSDRVRLKIRDVSGEYISPENSPETLLWTYNRLYAINAGRGDEWMFVTFPHFPDVPNRRYYTWVDPDPKGSASTPHRRYPQALRDLRNLTL